MRNKPCTSCNNTAILLVKDLVTTNKKMAKMYFCDKCFKAFCISLIKQYEERKNRISSGVSGTAKQKINN